MWDLRVFARSLSADVDLFPSCSDTPLRGIDPLLVILSVARPFVGEWPGGVEGPLYSSAISRSRQEISIPRARRPTPQPWVPQPFALFAKAGIPLTSHSTNLECLLLRRAWVPHSSRMLRLSALTMPGGCPIACPECSRRARVLCDRGPRTQLWGRVPTAHSLAPSVPADLPHLG
jgi:hypothetical protein